MFRSLKVPKVRNFKAKMDSVEQELTSARARREELSRKLAEILPTLEEFSLSGSLSRQPTRANTVARSCDDEGDNVIEGKVRNAGMHKQGSLARAFSRTVARAGIAVGLPATSSSHSLPKATVNTVSDISAEQDELYDSKGKDMEYSI